MRLDQVMAEALDAAVAVGRDQGLGADHARILSGRGNLLVHLAPWPVVARVATLTAFSRRDPSAWLRREVDVAGFAARHGGPVVPPAGVPAPGTVPDPRVRRVDPGPHRSGGFAVSLWTYVPAETATERAGPDDAGRALGRLHLSLARYPGQLPWLAPATDQISEGLAALEREDLLDRQRLSALRERHGDLLDGLDRVAGPAIVLHGDAHPGNLLRTGTVGEPRGGPGWAWTDLEETCRGPREWDLAVLAKWWDRAADARAALAAYAAVTGTAIPSAASLDPFGRIRDLEAAVWSLCMAHQDPDRYRAVAADLLARVLSAP